MLDLAVWHQQLRSWLIIEVIVVFAMTHQPARSTEVSLIFKAAFTVTPDKDHGGIEVDQIAIVRAVTLGRGDAVWVMTYVAGCVLAPDVLIVFLEAVAVEDAGATMTTVTEGIIRRTFIGVVRRFVATNKKRGIDGTMRAFRTGTAGLRGGIVIVAISTGNNAVFREWIDQTGDVRVRTDTGNGVH